MQVELTSDQFCIINSGVIDKEAGFIVFLNGYGKAHGVGFLKCPSAAKKPRMVTTAEFTPLRTSRKSPADIFSSQRRTSSIQSATRFTNAMRVVFQFFFIFLGVSCGRGRRLVGGSGCRAGRSRCGCLGRSRCRRRCWRATRRICSRLSDGGWAPYFSTGLASSQLAG